jgi:hypothetical protein
VIASNPSSARRRWAGIAGRCRRAAKEEVREAFLDTLDAEHVAFARAMLQSVAEHKRANQPDDERFIIDVKVRETPDGFAVDVWVPEYFDDN